MSVTLLNRPRTMRLPLLAAIVLATALPGRPLAGQAGPDPTLERGIAGVALGLRQLQGVKRVLLIGAHPDDEDTALLTALARGQGAETAYLSLTRGDGGQNLIGPELFEGLGVVRTGELLAARALDGGKQYFTRAFDYGYSKSADEALDAWPRDELVRDVVWVVRTFRPQVIVSVFSGTPADGHGQHQASGIVAQEAFEAAADPTRFPDLAAHGAEPWQAAKLYRLAWRTPQAATTHVETGRYDFLLGRSHHQLAMESRSQHRSQDMGAAQPLGPRSTGLVLLATAPGVEGDGGFWSGVDTTLAAVANGLDGYRTAVRNASTHLTAHDPAAVVPDLLAASRQLAAGRRAAGRDAPEFATLRNRLDETLFAAAGVVARARVADDLVVPGDTLDVTVELWNGGPHTLYRVSPGLLAPEGWEVTHFMPVEPGEAQGGPFGASEQASTLGPGGRVDPGQLVRWQVRVAVPNDADPSRLYFRRASRDGEMYRWPDDPGLWGLPKDPPPLRARVSLALHDPGAMAQAADDRGPVVASVDREVRFVDVDKALGEFTRPLLVVPAISVEVTPGVMAWPTGLQDTREMTVELGAESRTSGEVTLEAPAGWRVEPTAVPFSFEAPGQRRTIGFRVTPDGAAEGTHEFRAVATLDDGRRYDEGYRLIDYPHIERTAFFSPAVSRVSVAPVRVAEGLRVGYVMGSGDDGPEALRQMGVEVELVSPERVRAGDFRGFDVLVLGIRVYETRPDVAAANDALLAFAREGGTVVVQYNKQEYPQGGFAPYPVSMGRGAPRVTDEASPVEFVDPESPVLTWPNRLTAADFDGWVQERGLYFLSEWDERFRPQIAFTDPGEEPALGSLLVAPVGEGVYVYTGISFFRQFPAGVAGAYRLFANLVSLDGERWRAHLAGGG